MSISSLPTAMAAPQIHTPSTSSTSVTSPHFKFSSLSFSIPTPQFSPKSALKFALNTRSSLYLAASSLEEFVPETSFEEEEEEVEEPEISESEFESEEDEEDDEEEEVKVSKSRSRDQGRLYVGNLPYAMTGDQLREVFSEAGRVASVEIVYDRVTDRSRGFAFVTMRSVDEAKEAIRLYEGAQIGGRTVKVNFPEVPRGGEKEVMGPRIRNSYKGFVDSPHKIYVGNLSWDITSQQLRDIFADECGLLSAKVVYDRDTGRSRGFGFVTFASAEDVQSALNSLNGKDIEGRPLRLNLASDRARPASPSIIESDSRLDSNELLSSANS